MVASASAGETARQPRATHCGHEPGLVAHQRQATSDQGQGRLARLGQVASQAAPEGDRWAQPQAQRVGKDPGSRGNGSTSCAAKMPSATTSGAPSRSSRALPVRRDVGMS